MQVDRMERLSHEQRREVGELVAAASQVDGVEPLSEQVLLAVRGADTVSATTGSPHFLAYAGTHLAGYAHLERGLAGEAATAELVVDPARRRQGVGTGLVRALETAVDTAVDTASANTLQDAVAPDPGTLRLWSHGHLEGARAFAARDGYSIVRELWVMRRSLRPDAEPLPAARLPEGFRARHFAVGQDEDAWLRVNARAFADHPEQGRLTRRDLDRRIAEPWFDARGFILVEDMRGLVPVLAASHWTKVLPVGHSEADAEADAEGGAEVGTEGGAEGGAEVGAKTGTEVGTEGTAEVGAEMGTEISQKQGEVYVVGVDPAYQGLGLGRAVTILGLAHLRELGLSDAMLYVDADNSAAVATYSRLGFVQFAEDVEFSRAVHLPVPR